MSKSQVKISVYQPTRFIFDRIIGIRHSDGQVWEKTVIMDTFNGLKNTANFNFNGKDLNDPSYERREEKVRSDGHNKGRPYEAWYEKSTGKMLSGTFKWLDGEETTQPVIEIMKKNST